MNTREKQETQFERKMLPKLKKAIQKLWIEDSALFEYGVGERAITHRLAIHMAKHFPGWNIDCEYNKHGMKSKALMLRQFPAPVDLIRFLGISLGYEKKRDVAILQSIQTLLKNSSGLKVYPDIIVHTRGNPKENYLVLEVKRSANRDVRLDRVKLNSYTSGDAKTESGDFKYQYGASIVIGPNKATITSWIDGSEGHTYTVSHEMFESR